MGFKLIHAYYTNKPSAIVADDKQTNDSENTEAYSNLSQVSDSSDDKSTGKDFRRQLISAGSKSLKRDGVLAAPIATHTVVIADSKTPSKAPLLTTV